MLHLNTFKAQIFILIPKNWVKL